MSIITKIFVVLATVLAIVNVALMVSYVNNNEHFKGEYVQALSEKAVAQTAAQIAESQRAEADKVHAEAMKDVEQQKEGLVDRISKLVSELQTKDVAISDLRGRLVGVQADLKQSIASQKQAHQIITTLEGEVKTRRDAAIKAEKRTVELTDQNQELETRLQLAIENVRLLKEQLTDAEDQIRELKVKAAQVVAAAPNAATDSVSGLTPVAAPADIRGVITSVQQVGENDLFVAVNVGSNDLVAPGMNFIIHDGENYVGSLTITRVDLNEAAGRVTLRKGDVRQNQQVLASSN